MTQQSTQEKEQEEQAIASFAHQAASLCDKYLSDTDLYVWRSPEGETILVSQEPHDWLESEDAMDDGFLLRIRKDGGIVEFISLIGGMYVVQMTPFRGGWSPIELAENLIRKLAHFELTEAGSLLEELITGVLHMNDIMRPVGIASVHSEICESGGEVLYRCDVHQGLTNIDWFCVAFILNEQGMVGVWERTDFDRQKPFHMIDFSQDIWGKDISTWLKSVLLSDSVYSELARDL
jgi:hypothetical protein